MPRARRPALFLLGVLGLVPFGGGSAEGLGDSGISGSIAGQNKTSHCSCGGWLMKEYPYLTFSMGGFVQQVAVCYLRDGYWFYVQGRVRPGKDPLEVDRQILERYRPDGSKD